MAERIRWMIASDPQPSDAQWRAIGESWTHGDPPMDRVVDWMIAEGVARTKPLFDRAVALGIDQIASPPPALRDFFAIVDARPSWVDPDRMSSGARASGISGLTGMDTLRDLGLVAGYQASAINRALILTKALEKGPQRRLAETTKWWIDCTRPGGMERYAAGFQTTLQVRLIHGLVRRHVRAMPQWDESFYGVPVNQGDMHATYLAFSVIFLFGQRLLGVPLTRREGDDVMHLWRYIGWLLGVDERWLVDSEQEGRVALYQNLLAQSPADDSSRQLGAAVVDEPLARKYRDLPRLRGLWNRAKHLSIARAFIGGQGMRDLGMPSNALPWYPLLTVMPRALYHAVHRALPGGRERLIRRGLERQADYLVTMFGNSTPLVEAAHITQRDSR